MSPWHARVVRVYNVGQPEAEVVAVVHAAGLRLDMSLIDYVLLVMYFVVVLGVGFLARRSIHTSLDFFLSGRSLPAWITGLAFISANLGAIEILGMAANGASYGMATVHFYWIGAVPAMVFLGIVMMPFYYGSKVRSVPEYLRRRFNPATHLLNAITFAVASVLIAGVNLYALAIVVQALLGWDLWVAIVLAAAFVLAYITLGGLSSAIYNEVLQFFVILAGLIPLTIVALTSVGGWGGLLDRVERAEGEGFISSWEGTAIGDVSNPLGANWFAIVFGLGFVLSFGYWTTNFAEVQRAMSARNMSASRRTPLIGAFPKLFIPLVTIIPGLIALLIAPKVIAADANNAIPALIDRLMPTGVLGIAVTGLLAAFMAGMAANVSSFNTVFTYDIWQDYIRRDRPDEYYLRIGRLVTVIGVCIGIGTAFIASGYENIMDYIQLLFSFFNAPLFATFIIGMFWRRMTPWAGFWGLLAGTLGAAATWGTYRLGWITFNNSDLNQSFWGAIVAFTLDALVTVLVTMVTTPKPADQLGGLVYGVTKVDTSSDNVVGDEKWYRSPVILGGAALAVSAALYLPVL